MKARPRSVERRVAEYLSERFSDVGKSSVERIPVLGRTGPDISINELGWVIDVKSRLSIPKDIFPASETLLTDWSLAVIRLEDLGKQGLVNNFVKFRKGSFQKQVYDYFHHMDEWRVEHRPLGITMLILHRPRMPIGKSAVVVQNNTFWRMIKWQDEPVAQN